MMHKTQRSTYMRGAEKGHTMQLQFLYLCPICLALAGVFIAIEAAGSYLVADVIKGVASAFFVILGFLGATMCSDVTYARLIFFGLALGAVADVLLNLRYVYEGKKGQLFFLAGIAVFLAGHVLYLLATLPYIRWAPFTLVVGIVLTGLLLYWIFGQVEAKPAFKIFGVFYIGAVTILNCFALSALTVIPGAHSLMFLAGTLLFLVSDVILILNTFGPRQRFVMRVSNLMLYYVGQLLIALCLQLPL